MYIKSGVVSSVSEARIEVKRIGFPILITPFGEEFSGENSYVVNDDKGLEEAIELALENSYPPARVHVVHRDGNWWMTNRTLVLGYVDILTTSIRKENVPVDSIVRKTVFSKYLETPPTSSEKDF
jgi:carbamoylphosphate synthase large subunit